MARKASSPTPSGQTSEERIAQANAETAEANARKAKAEANLAEATAKEAGKGASTPPMLSRPGWI